jgi:hypothetical protein
MRRTAILALAGALALAGCSRPAHLERPPARFQGDRAVVALLTADPIAACRRIGAVAPEGRVLVACEQNNVLVLLNPCLIPPGEDEWADDACHELGHAGGWPANHPR